MVSARELPPIFTDEQQGTATQEACISLVKERFPEYLIDRDIPQGGCSYTVKLRPRKRTPSEDQQELVVQFRPSRYALSTEAMSTPREWYGELAPSVEETGRIVAGSGAEFRMYRVSSIPGRRLDEVLSRDRSSLVQANMEKCEALLTDLAEFHARAWLLGRRHKHQDSWRAQCKGRIGSSLLWRLHKLACELPSKPLRSTAAGAVTCVESGCLNGLPVVLTHGDLLPSNILVDAQTWSICGLIDWAESEMLPFGLSLYGVEHVLGSLLTSASRPRFAYVGRAAALRRHFWRELCCKVPELESREVKEAVALARTIGILLWHGFAWDGGSIDRVVELGRDGEELAYLEAFLGVSGDAALARL